MFKTGWLQKLFGLLMAIWGGGGAAAYLKVHDSSTAALIGAAGLAGLLINMGPSWRKYANKLSPENFPPDIPVEEPTIDLGDKGKEVALYQCYQELVEACQEAKCYEGMTSLKDAWNHLFDVVHLNKVQSQKTGNTQPLTK